MTHIKTAGRLKDEDGNEIRSLDAGTPCSYDAEAKKTFGIRTHRWINANPESCQGGSIEGWFAEYKLDL